MSRLSYPFVLTHYNNVVSVLTRTGAEEFSRYVCPLGLFTFDGARPIAPPSAGMIVIVNVS